MDSQSIADQWAATSEDDKGCLTGLERDVLDIIAAQLPKELSFSDTGEPLDPVTSRFVEEFDTRNPGISSGFRGAALSVASGFENGEDVQNFVNEAILEYG